ncbi:SPFH domain-containing protein, partial [Streptomyces sp. NPDC126499]|uniref:SPFH domain-containing protein n=1 Tax=Streptomyces sp. NPDC126499 TaxID=3155314 RepID=UPI003329AD6C
SGAAGAPAPASAGTASAPRGTPAGAGAAATPERARAGGEADPGAAGPSSAGRSGSAPSGDRSSAAGAPGRPTPVPAGTDGAPRASVAPPTAPSGGAPSRDKGAAGGTAPPRRGVLDLRRILGVPVKTVAVPVVASATVAPRAGAAGAGGVAMARRRTVIGNESTGSIPVHLLFRDEPEGGARDDGPATVPVPKTPAPKTPASKTPSPKPPASKTTSATPAIPAPARPAPASNRPAPTADPKLVERPGPVLPGWVGVAGGAVALLACAAIVWWAGAVPDEAARMLGLPSRPYHGIPLGQWALLALGVLLALFFLGGLGRGRVGYALVLTLFGEYRGTVRRTGLLWVSPLLLRRRVDVRLRHWRSEPLPAVDAKGTALNVVVLVVWRIRDTVRAALGVDRHEEYLREQVEAAMARVLSQLPADAFHEDAPTLRDSEAVGEALTRMLSAECAPVGIDVFSAQPTRIEYAPEVAAAMQRRRIAAIDAKHRDSVLTSVVDAVDDVVHRLTSRGLVELDDYERKALVKDLTVAFYTGRTAPADGA